MADDFERARRVLQRLPGEINRQVTAAFKLSGQKFQAAMIDQFVGYSNPRTAEDRLQNRSGDAGLRRATSYDVSGEFGGGSPLTLTAFVAGKKYARMQEFGGTIKPKSGKFLTIPVADNLTPGGRVRYSSFRDLRERYPDQTYLVPAKKGGWLLFSDGKPGAKPPKNGKAKPQLLFVLKPQVTIPPRFGFKKTWDSLAGDRRQKLEAALAAARKAAEQGAA